MHRKTTVTLLTLTLAFALNTPRGTAEDHPGLRGVSWQSFAELTEAEQKLVNALRKPLLEAKDVSGPLSTWLEGRMLSQNNRRQEANNAWKKALKNLTENEFAPLPPVHWDEPPDADLEFLEPIDEPKMTNADGRIVRWNVDDLTQYGVLIYPKGMNPRDENAKPRPLILYLHGAAYGVPYHVLPWLGNMAAQGYVIVAPGLRGEDLFAGYFLPPELPDYKSEGAIENLDGEVDDALTAVEAAQKLPGVMDEGFAMLGHSFGAGVGLLAAARHPETRCAVSYDAWLVNPFRYYWDRMRRGPNNWQSWAAFCNQPADEQLAGLMQRSIVHHADRLHSPLLMFIGGAYQGSVFHQSHADLIEQLKQNNIPYEYDVVEGGGHNFVLYHDSPQAKYAYKRHMTFLRKHWPPSP